MRLLTDEQLRQAMSQMGKRGGAIGGKRRLTTMTPSQRTKAARKAAKARWARVKSAKGDVA